MLGPATLALTLLASSIATSAAPLFTKDVIQKRADANLVVLNFASVLEALESTFYKQGLEKFQPADFEAAGFSSAQLVTEQLNVIKKDEDAHVSALSAAISASGGGAALGSTCTFDFGPALSSVGTFMATARVLELVGVGAYLGGATLLTSKGVLSAAGQILTIEARHSSLLNSLNLGQFQSQAVDVSLTPSSVLALASGFITGGCDISTLGLTAAPSLAVTSDKTPVAEGAKLSFTTAGPSVTGQLFCQHIVGGSTTAVVFPMAECVVPAGIAGPVFTYITNDGTPLSTDINTQNAGVIVAGPALTFVDPAPTEALATALRSPAQAAAAAPPPAAPAAASEEPPMGAGAEVVSSPTDGGDGSSYSYGDASYSAPPAAEASGSYGDASYSAGSDGGYSSPPAAAATSAAPPPTAAGGAPAPAPPAIGNGIGAIVISLPN